MENASKALLIAGGILIAMITISIFYGVFRGMSDMADATLPKTEQKELQAFNARFEAYNKKLMYGMDIVSVLNMAIDNNTRYGLSQNYDDNADNDLIDFYVNIKLQYNGSEWELKNDYDKIKAEIIQETGKPVSNRSSEFLNFQQAPYKCSSVTYVEKGEIEHNVGAIGRIKEMVFEPY